MHNALPDAAPGLVEAVAAGRTGRERQEIEGWDAPFDTESEKSPRVQLGAKNRQACEACGARRGLAARDVLVLVRQRGPLFEAIIRALRTRACRSQAPTGWC